jgi:hypothetical protein
MRLRRACVFGAFAALVGCNAILGNEEGVLVGQGGEGASGAGGATAGGPIGGKSGGSHGGGSPAGEAGATAAPVVGGEGGGGGEATCMENEARCDAGGERQECQNAGWQAAPCEATEVCHEGRCLGSRLEQCTEQGAWSFEETCSGANPVCNETIGACVALRVVGGFAGKHSATKPNVRVTGQFLVRPNLCKSNTCVRGGFSP